MRNINQDTFETETATGKVLVDFYTDTCHPCKQMIPVLEQIAGERTDIKVLKINAMENSQLASKFYIQTVPTFVLMDSGTFKAQRSGVVTKANMISWMKENLG